MAKTNKELAVELYSAFLISSSNIISSPNFKGTVALPTHDEMVEQVRLLASTLSAIQDN